MPHYHPTLAELWTYPAGELAAQIHPVQNPPSQCHYFSGNRWWVLPRADPADSFALFGLVFRLVSRNMPHGS
jgi:hypothetical protein